MKSVLVLMSSYNGYLNIERQIESIMNQKDVVTFLLVRDDGSKDNTIVKLQELKKKYSDRMFIFSGKNIGWRMSFFETIKNSGEYDYYAFSDQDDYWFREKLIECINLMESDCKKGPKLAHCNCLSVDEKLIPRQEQEKRKPMPSDFKKSLINEYFQGCGMVWNREAMTIIKKHIPRDKNIAHDFWVGLISYLFGEIYFLNKELFYHIRYGNNASCDGDILKGRLSRVRLFWSDGCVYMNPVKDILLGYEALLDAEQVSYLQLISTYKESLKNKIKLLCDVEFRRESFASTIIFKIAILLNRF